MKLYEIEAKYRDLVELLTEEAENPDHYKAFDEIQQERDRKLAAICTLIKEARHEVAALKAEAKALAERAAVTERVEERLVKYLELCLMPGEKFKDPHHKIGWRASEAVEVFDESQLPGDFWVQVAPRVDKAAIKEALKGGKAVPGAKIQHKNNIQIG